MENLSYVTLDSLKKGQTFYKVYALGHRSFIETIRVASDVKAETYSFGNFIYVEDPEGTQHSLQDAGIIPNNYNKHKSFYEYSDAEKYLEQVK